MADEYTTSETTDRPTSGGLQVAVITPEGSAYDGVAESVVIPAHDGEVAFLRGHAPFVGALGIGELRVRSASGAAENWYLEGGVVQVLDNVVSILAERVQPIAEIDADVAAKDLEEAGKLVPTSDHATLERDQKLASARTRLKVAAKKTSGG